MTGLRPRIPLASILRVVREKLWWLGHFGSVFLGGGLFAERQQSGIVCLSGRPAIFYSARIHSGRKATLPSRAWSIRARVFSLSLGIRARMGR